MGLLYMQVQHQGVQTGLKQQRDTGVHVDESLPYPMSTAKSLSAIDAALIAKGVRCALQQRLQGLCTQFSRNCGSLRLRSFRTAQANRSKLREIFSHLPCAFQIPKPGRHFMRRGGRLLNHASLRMRFSQWGPSAGVASSSTCAQADFC